MRENDKNMLALRESICLAMNVVDLHREERERKNPQVGLDNPPFPTALISSRA